jgi:GTP-binding protein EngB required for normal cell division
MSDIHKAIDSADKVINVLEKLGVLDRVKAFFSGKEPHDILLLGASGAGKSSFRDHIFGDTTEISRFERTTVVMPRLGKLSGTLIRLIDTPGQSHEKAKQERRKAIFQAQQSKRLGIINVVSFGYHEGVTDTSNVIDEKSSVRGDFLENRRQEELNQISEWSEILCGEGGAAKWIITLVTKSDLWWTPTAVQQVMLHYADGDYFRRLGSAQRVNHAVLPYCSTNQLFYGAVPMTGFYSDDLRRDHHVELVAHILKNCATTTS